MELDGMFGDREARRNLLVSEPGRKEPQHLNLAWRERFDERLGTLARNGVRCAKEQLDVRSVQDHETHGCCFDRRDNLRPSKTTGKYRLNSRPQGFRDRLGGGIPHEQDHRAARFSEIHGLARRVVGKRLGFDEQNIRLRFESGSVGRISVGRFGDQAKARMRSKQAFEARPGD